MSANALDDLPGMGPRSRRNAVLVLAIWSVFAVVPMVNFFGEHRAAWRIVVVVAAYVPFIVVYLKAMIRLRRRAPEPADRPFMAALVALSAVLIAAGGEPFVAMLVFTSVAAGRRLQPHEARRVVFALGAGAAVTTWAYGDDTGNVVALTFTTIGLGWWMIGFTQLLSTVQELHAAREEIARLAVADERVRFARDLHDLLGHSLSLIALKAELAGRLLPGRVDEAAREIDDIAAVSRRSLGEVREAVGGYRRPTLGAELAGAREALAAAGIAVEADAPPAELPADAEAVLAWTVREATTNLLRHAGARRVAIRLGTSDDEASVEVVDDGRGADDGSVDDGSGLAGLAERVARHRGRLEAAPRAEGGFRVAVSLPLGAGP